MREYRVHKLGGPFTPEQALDSDLWKGIPAASIDRYPWYRSGLKQETQVRLAYTADALHILFVAADIHSYAEKRELNGAVCKDSCVEFFASPWPERGLDYFNLEINCAGALHLGFGVTIVKRRLVSAETASRVAIRGTLPGPTKDEQRDDREWRIYARLPRELLNEFCGRELAFEGKWRGNFYRCGGKTDEQYACWNPIEFPQPHFHQPAQFGSLVFGA